MPAVTVGDVYRLACLGRPEGRDALKHLYEWRQARFLTIAKGVAAASAAAVAAAIAESLKATAKDAVEAPVWVFVVVLGWALLLIVVAALFQFLVDKVHHEYSWAAFLLAMFDPPSTPPTTP